MIVFVFTILKVWLFLDFPSDEPMIGALYQLFLWSFKDKTSTVSYGTAFLFFQRGKGWEKDNPEKRNTLPLIMYHIALLDFSIQRGYLFTPLRLKRFL